MAQKLRICEKMKLFYRGKLLGLIALVALLQLSACAQTIFVVAANDTTPPVIAVWYGSRQEFGSQGLPQKWVNILGNIFDSESSIREAAYVLNGGQPVPLRLGPDERRLVRPGDINIEIDASRLTEGENHLQITANNGAGLQSTSVVTVVFHQRSWPLPYTVDWSKVSQIQSTVQIVDGRWELASSGGADTHGIRPVELGYDRLLAIGDMNWTNYEVSISITLHGIDPVAYQVKGSPGAGFGIVLHWLGHTDEPVKCDWPSQPHCGWHPSGATGWYSFKQSGIDTLGIESGPPETNITITTRKLALGHTYQIKMRVINHPDGNAYFLRVWEPGVETEPGQWTLQRVTKEGYKGQSNLDHGSILLALHRVDATIGKISVTPVDSNP
jgi:hypothetical protein